MSIDIEINGAIAITTINRPDRHNVMDVEHYEALSQAWTRVRDEDGIRCSIITGAGA